MKQKRNYARDAEAVAEALVYAVVGHLLPSPVVNSPGELDAAEAYADRIVAKLGRNGSTQLVRIVVETIDRLTEADETAHAP
jgi:hypothetical protein